MGRLPGIGGASVRRRRRVAGRHSASSGVLGGGKGCHLRLGESCAPGFGESCAPGFPVVEAVGRRWAITAVGAVPLLSTIEVVGKIVEGVVVRFVVGLAVLLVLQRRRRLARRLRLRRGDVVPQPHRGVLDVLPRQRAHHVRQRRGADQHQVLVGDARHRQQLLDREAPDVDAVAAVDPHPRHLQPRRPEVAGHDDRVADGEGHQERADLVVRHQHQHAESRGSRDGRERDAVEVEHDSQRERHQERHQRLDRHAQQRARRLRARGVLQVPVPGHQTDQRDHREPAVALLARAEQQQGVEAAVGEQLHRQRPQRTVDRVRPRVAGEDPRQLVLEREHARVVDDVAPRAVRAEVLADGQRCDHRADDQRHAERHGEHRRPQPQDALGGEARRMRVADPALGDLETAHGEEPHEHALVGLHRPFRREQLTRADQRRAVPVDDHERADHADPRESVVGRCEQLGAGVDDSGVTHPDHPITTWPPPPDQRCVAYPALVDLWRPLPPPGLPLTAGEAGGNRRIVIRPVHPTIAQGCKMAVDRHWCAVANPERAHR